MAEEDFWILKEPERNYIKEHSHSPLIHQTIDLLPQWEAEGDSKYTRIVAMAYPRDNYFVLEVLKDGEWVEDSAKWQETFERALSAAQSLANRIKVPVRIKEVIDL